VFKQVFFLAFTEFASSTALHLVMSDLNINISRKQICRTFITYFIANASVQQAQVPLVLQAVILASNVVMVSEHVPVKVELMVTVSQLVAMVVLQLARVEPLEAALDADLTTTQLS
jgi:hypothetical protein